MEKTIEEAVKIFNDMKNENREAFLKSDQSTEKRLAKDALQNKCNWSIAQLRLWWEG